MKFIDVLWIGVGGFFGTLSRYGIALAMQTQSSQNVKPIATFLVNIAGSFLLGAIVGVSANTDILKDNVKLSLTIGFCGAFTTFSALMLESYHFLKNDKLVPLAIYVSLSLLLGLLALMGGLFIGKYFSKTF